MYIYIYVCIDVQIQHVIFFNGCPFIFLLVFRNAS